jgi:hypothetical protein
MVGKRHEITTWQWRNFTKVVRVFPMETGYSMYFPLSLLDYQRLYGGILKKN